MRKLLIAGLVLPALFFSGCGAQGEVRAEPGHGGHAAPASAESPESPESPSAASGGTRVVSEMRTCDLLFHGHSPLISRSLRMAMRGHQHRPVDQARVGATARQLREVAARTRPSWRPAILAIATDLPQVTDGQVANRDYQRFRAAHRTVVAHCTVFVD